MAEQLHGVYLAWTKRFISLNSWRIEGDFEDCLQEAQMKFIQCQNKYGEVEPPHLMSLFQSAVVRHFHTLSNKRSTYVNVRKECTLKHSQYIKEGIRGTCNVPVELLHLQTKLWNFVTQLEFMAMAIKQELYEATGYTGDNSEELLKRADNRDHLTDSAYEALSEEAKNWLDKAITASNNDKPLPSLITPKEKQKAKGQVAEPKNSNGTTGRSGRFAETGVIKILIRGNPKRRNSISFDMYSLYKDGMTVKEYLAAGGRRRDLNWDTKQKFIEVAT